MELLEIHQDDTFLVSIENANEKDVKAMIIDMYYDSTVLLVVNHKRIVYLVQLNQNS